MWQEISIRNHKDSALSTDAGKSHGLSSWLKERRDSCCFDHADRDDLSGRGCCAGPHCIEGTVGVTRLGGSLSCVSVRLSAV